VSLLAVPFDWRANPVANTAILDAFCQHPGWFSAPLEPTQVRVAAAALITHPDHMVWGVWSGGNLVGGVLFTEYVPQVSARLHFVFLDNNLVGRRKFLWQFIGRAFRDLQLQRIGYEFQFKIDVTGPAQLDLFRAWTYDWPEPRYEQCEAEGACQAFRACSGYLFDYSITS
jgi:hypothetical protein